MPPSKLVAATDAASTDRRYDSTSQKDKDKPAVRGDASVPAAKRHDAIVNDHAGTGSWLWPPNEVTQESRQPFPHEYQSESWQAMPTTLGPAHVPPWLVDPLATSANPPSGRLLNDFCSAGPVCTTESIPFWDLPVSELDVDPAAAALLDAALQSMIPASTTDDPFPAIESSSLFIPDVFISTDLIRSTTWLGFPDRELSEWVRSQTPPLPPLSTRRHKPILTLLICFLRTCPAHRATTNQEQ